MRRRAADQEIVEAMRVGSIESRANLRRPRRLGISIHCHIEASNQLLRALLAPDHGVEDASAASCVAPMSER